VKEEAWSNAFLILIWLELLFVLDTLHKILKAVS
jgi:hypothetical protein